MKSVERRGSVRVCEFFIRPALPAHAAPLLVVLLALSGAVAAQNASTTSDGAFDAGDPFMAPKVHTKKSAADATKRIDAKKGTEAMIDGDFGGTRLWDFITYLCLKARMKARLSQAKAVVLTPFPADRDQRSRYEYKLKRGFGLLPGGLAPKDFQWLFSVAGVEFDQVETLQAVESRKHSLFLVMGRRVTHYAIVAVLRELDILDSVGMGGSRGLLVDPPASKVPEGWLLPLPADFSFDRAEVGQVLVKLNAELAAQKKSIVYYGAEK